MKKVDFSWQNLASRLPHPICPPSIAGAESSSDWTRLSLVLASSPSAEVCLEDYELIAGHPDLPAWWELNGNKAFRLRRHSDRPLPRVTTHPGLPPPESKVVFFNGSDELGLMLWGRSGLVFLSEDAYVPGAIIAAGEGFVYLGEQVRSTARLTINCRNNGAIVILKDCLIASDITLMTDDCHAVIDLQSGDRVNTFGGVIWINEHVWIGDGSRIMGDCVINSQSVIGFGTFLRGVETPGNSVIAGNPPRAVRTGITWDMNDVPPR
jgi:acetyltransferase-like isoleucine patch superfamily enzyme